jgi:hypothetical protein
MLRTVLQRLVIISELCYIASRRSIYRNHWAFCNKLIAQTCSVYAPVNVRQRVSFLSTGKLFRLTRDYKCAESSSHWPSTSASKVILYLVGFCVGKWVFRRCECACAVVVTTVMLHIPYEARAVVEKLSSCRHFYAIIALKSLSSL